MEHCSKSSHHALHFFTFLRPAGIALALILGHAKQPETGHKMTLINPITQSSAAYAAKKSAAAAIGAPVAEPTPTAAGSGFSFAPAASASTNFYAQLSGYTEPTAGSSAVDDFLAFINQTPEEIMFDMMLAEEGLTREEFDALPPEQKQDIIDKIMAKIKDRTEQEIAESMANGQVGAEQAANDLATVGTVNFRNMSPDELRETVNALIKSGQLTLDETSSLVPLMAPENAILTFYQPDQKINMIEKLEQSLAFNESIHNYNGMTYDRKAIEALMRFQQA